MFKCCGILPAASFPPLPPTRWQPGALLIAARPQTAAQVSSRVRALAAAALPVEVVVAGEEGVYLLA